MAYPINFDKLINTTINYLYIVSEGEPHITKGGNKHRTAICRCTCGKEGIHQISAILNGSIKSCGCYSAKIASERAKINNHKHGLIKTPEYNIWVSLRKRCFNPKHKSYKDYGGRGITVCERWNKFENFYEDMGSRPSKEYSIDRIDVNGNYCKENCRWATRKEQARNQRNNILITYNGETKCMGEWVETSGISWQALFYRIYIAKWDLDSAFNTPLKHYHGKKTNR